MENKKNKIGFWIFIIILLILGIGGYFGMKYVINTDFSKTKNVKKEEKEIDNRIDQNKDYIYYDNETQVIKDLYIGFQNVHVNLKSAENVNNNLNSEETEYRKSVVYLKDHPVDAGVEYDANEEGVYGLNYREYNDFVYEDYVSLLVKDYTYDVIKGSNGTKTKAYVFNKKENSAITEDELLSKYKVTMDNIKTKVKAKLNANQTTVDDKPAINIDATLNNFTYAIYINKIGKLEATFLVKSTNSNYYDTIVLN
jgi:hypothetical protein